MPAEIVVGSLGELVDRVTPADPDSATGRRRDSGVYHGASDASWPLLTSLDRLGGVHPPHTKAGLKGHSDSRPENDWELLVAAQHHGLPTRLLDWSYSPLVAAHFATRREDTGRDCALWRLDWQAVHTAFGLLEPPSLDARIVAQAVAFTLCSDKSCPFDTSLEKHRLGDALTKFVIPASQVARLRDQLDMVSVDERRLFPDLDGVTAQMRRYYS